MTTDTAETADDSYGPPVTTISETVDEAPGFARRLIVTTSGDGPDAVIRRHEEAVSFYRNLRTFSHPADQVGTTDGSAAAA